MRHELAVGKVLDLPYRKQTEAGPVRPECGRTFCAYHIPSSERSEDWLDRVSSQLEEAARSWPAIFWVSPGEIRKKLATAEDLIVLADEVSMVVGFVSARYPLIMRRTGLTVRYIEGAIGHRTRGEKGKFALLMESLGGRADVEVLHTQNPKMAEALGKRSEVLFPSRDNSLALGPRLLDDLRDLLEKIGRADPFDSTSGIVSGMYGHRLYSDWPLPGSEDAMSFRLLDQESGVLVIGFKEAKIADRWLVSSAAEIRL